MNFPQWARSAAAWFIGGRRVPTATTKAVADAVVRQSNADIGVLVTRLTSGEITVAQLEPLMQQAIKRGIIANGALAHGGYDRLTAPILERLEDKVLVQHDFLHRRVQAIASNVRATGEVRPRDGAALVSYANAFRATYENEVLEARRDVGHTRGRRLLAGAVSHCEDCEEIAAMGWMPIEELLEEYPIGADACKSACYCVVDTE